MPKKKNFTPHRNKISDARPELKLPPTYELTKEELAEFKKVGDVGAQRAARSLSILIDEKVDVKALTARALPVEKISRVVGGPEEIATTVIFRVTGDVEGNILLIIPQENALALADLLARRKVGATRRLSELDKSALKETGNILSGSFLAALTNYLNVSMIESIPDIATDMAKATIDHVLAEFSQRAEQALAFEVDFELISEKVRSFFFLLLDLESAAKVLKTVRKKMKK